MLARTTSPAAPVATQGAAHTSAPTTNPVGGECDALKGHIYDCSDARQKDIYTKTTKEIAEYVGFDVQIR
jgi:hypothetical protein